LASSKYFFKNAAHCVWCVSVAAKAKPPEDGADDAAKLEQRGSYSEDLSDGPKPPRTTGDSVRHTKL